MSQDPGKPPASLRDRNKQLVRQRIVDAATRLVARHGYDGVTADAIAAEAQVGRATFFRYFDSKEAAIIVGFYEERLTALVDVLAQAPAALAPMDAVLWTFTELSKQPGRNPRMVRLHVRMITTSPALHARAFEFHARYVEAIADAVAGRFRAARKPDPRPRLLAAATLAVVQASLEDWAAGDDRNDPAGFVLPALEHLKAGFTDRKQPARAAA